MVRIHFLRHGETHNPDKIVYGRRPLRLTEKGREQAAAAGDRLWEATAGHPLLWGSSPVYRAMETAIRACSAFTGKDLSKDWRPETDEFLTESESIFDGAKVPDVAKRLASWKHLVDPHLPSWGEPYYDTFDRMEAAMLNAADEAELARVGNVVLVSHQLPIWILRLGLEGRPFGHDPASRQCGHASITTVTLERGVPTDINYWHNPVH